ncbi:type II toxin-antitoxin system VapC family toxin [Nocardia cyriacigeorgica]|uniref:Ribonuclease VapC n=1 Tax=Nocardia cyriacigeorgica TaxID=135487 RepID=A0A5R8NDA4_9NOCA|nr:type II toxin-antitoxin system VapC family toxin [Nocardia cyriacigeorgica]TLF73614.1 type II toxin-antitoxin system VapC family toxin [Nocardia cyriacigeorgica]
MIVDVNVLLYAVDESSPHHEVAHAWLQDAMNGDVRVGLPWHSLVGFVRISTHPKIFAAPMTGREAWQFVDEWLDHDMAWVPLPTDRHRRVLGRLIDDHYATGNLVPDAHLAALAIEHGVAICSFDTDFARFPEVEWINPLQR